MDQNIPINPENVAWAQARAGLDTESLAKKMEVSPIHLLSWLDGREPMTFEQVKTLAEQTHTPIGYLLSSKPPNDVLPIRDFRFFGDRGQTLLPPSGDLLETVYLMQQRQDWFHEYLVASGASSLPFVEHHGLRQDMAVAVVVASIRECLHIAQGKGIAEHLGGPYDAIGHLVEFIAEQTGILIMLDGFVGAMPRRRLKVTDFRGFALCNDYAPLLFVNGQGRIVEQIYTLVHELAHIWIGEAGISNLDGATLDNAGAVELFCDAVAVELLVPHECMFRIWASGPAPEQCIAMIARQCNVSTLLVARCALSHALISKQWYTDYHERETHREDASGSDKATEESDADFFTAYFRRVDRRLAIAVIVATLEGRLFYREAHRLLGITKTKTFNRLAELLGYQVSSSLR